MESLSCVSCPFFVTHHQPYPFAGQLSTTRARLRSALKVNATSLVVPLLPFNSNEVLVPSESKILHLYEARYLALLEEVERLDVGALVSIRGVGRVKIVKFFQADPFLKGEVIPMQDTTSASPSDVSSKVLSVKEAVYSLNSLEIKLKAPKEAVMQTYVLNSLQWAEKQPSLDCDEAFIPSLPERVSFAAFQPVSGSTQSELVKLQQEKLKAMDLRDTKQRLNNSLEFVKGSISMLAAKLAIQALEMQ
ncbi:uncharacterized protein LOC18040570 isoform X2 [Citrus clementina]|uniref:uncharacterized protein LOC18040570 isoform X2 n=1 Tax=Citrus clementina TaxID=85681 RepID=UPI000CED3E8C|nr:uncharacterized protein LOC18040570 isoform X2 [Citrus x clementina]